VDFGNPLKAAQAIIFPTPGAKLTTDGQVTLAARSFAGLPISYTLVSGPAILTGATLTLTGAPGTVVVRASQAGNDTIAAATDVTVSFAVGADTRVRGAGAEVGSNIVHPNGNVYDQVLLTGASATITADAGQVTRISFIDLNDDIVQVEFSGAGTLTLTLDNASGPAAPLKYNQPTVAYMKGHASIAINGANETSNVSVFSVGTINAVNQALFPSGMSYDAIADIGLITIASSNGRFGGVRAANASFFHASGQTGIYAPGVAMEGPVFIGDITADSSATAVMMFGSTTNVRVAGGDLFQINSRPVQVEGLGQLVFANGTKSNGQLLLAQPNRARFERNGIDVTNQTAP
jgi:hypothetical protein